ncbi:MAG TPA: 2-C-methyl-D-erythritol 2,4-cyclodiphosphate synthase [Candidatus Hydrogenedentes bacterium]|nr:2-C-methyl-D-erythritol 2,4-cyclodiphosphate synthase [Candidatus Hydrogenedentota bacterium]
MRVGIGYDIHRLVEDRPLILGGVTIPHHKGLFAHSDGDVLCHAISDALLGAAGLPNIGEMFPDSAPCYKDSDSIELLEIVVVRLNDAGYAPLQVDANIIAEQPKLQPHLARMSQNIAERLGIAPDRVSIKPRTNEGLGPEGREEAISAHAVALIQEKA